MNLLKKLLQRSKQSEFFINFKTLASGTLISQIIMLAASPLITRIYSPEEFGIFALFAAIVSILVPISSLKYNTAIVVAKTDKESQALFFLSILILLFFSFFILFFSFVGKNFFINFLDIELLNFWWHLIFFVILLQSLNLIISNYLNRHKNYKLISRISIIRSVIYVLIVITLGYFGFTRNGLFFGEIISALIILIVATFNLKKLFKIFKIKEKLNLFNLIAKYKDFLIHSFIALNLPTIHHQNLYRDSQSKKHRYLTHKV